LIDETQRLFMIPDNEENGRIAGGYDLKFENNQK